MTDIKFKQMQQIPTNGSKLEPETDDSKKTSPDKTSKFTKHSKAKWFVIIAIVIIALAGAGVVGFFWWYNDALQPVSTSQNRIKVTVESGETAKTIGAKLQQKGVIKSAFAFEYYVQQSGALNNLKAGSYLLSSNQSVKEIVEWLAEGKIDQFNMTILPGKTLADIKELLVADGYSAADVDAAYAKKYDHPLLKTKPANVNLEGYIFPDTYQISSETTVEQLLVKTFDVFYQQIQDEGLEAKLSAKGFTLHQGIVLASIVELEANSVADRQQVAQVFESRLASGMTLGSDVTFFYAAELLGVEPTISIDSPYNTRLYKGLPPGAISNFTIDALQAVAEPAAGDYLYFVAGDDGTVYYAKTEEEHQKNINNYCTKLCQ